MATQRNITTPPDQQWALIQPRCAQIIDADELQEKLTRSYVEDRPLIVKLGADPSRPDLHLGHAIVLEKMALLQSFGHTIQFVIGDFTALIGDPTGRNKTRPPLTPEEVATNAATYKQQCFRILNPHHTQVLTNSSWLQHLSPMAMIRLLATKTVQQLLAREDFANRMNTSSPIFLHELSYPLLQAYDSVHMRADIELGGTDQLFNLLLGRELQKESNLRPQSLILTPLLEGLDGTAKMSKSLDNYIALTDEPATMYGKIMSISDTLMRRYYELLWPTHLPAPARIFEALDAETLHPMQAKKDLAFHIVARFWGHDAATKAASDFTTIFSERQTPQDLPEFALPVDMDPGAINVIDLTLKLGFAPSRSEARRLLAQGGIRLDGHPVSSEHLHLESNHAYVFRFGKRRMIRLVTAAP